MKLNTKQKILIALVLIMVAIASRFLPHLWNFTALTAVSLFAGNYLGFRWSFLIVIPTMLISDFFIGFYDFKLMSFVYGSFILVALLPLLFKGKGFIQTASMSLSGSLLFFLITNWAVWYFGVMYSPDFTGLMASYVAGIPFLKNAILGDLWYTFILFGVYEFVQLKIAEKNQKLALQKNN
jgi:hypothetical protein